MLTRDSFEGPWAGLPVAWDDAGEFDEGIYRAAVGRCCDAGVPGVYTGGTTGEFYAMELDEFEAVARVTVEECHAHGTPAMAGCTATSTRGAARRAALAARLGADAVQVALPFWMEVPDAEVVPFFREVAAAAGGLPLSIYDTLRTRKALSTELHQQIKASVPSFVMVKANAGTAGCTPEGCAALSEFVNVFVSETKWADLGPHGVRGSCSAMVYWNPRITLELWHLLRTRQWDALGRALRPVLALHQYLGSHFEPQGFTDTAYDHMCGVATGFLPMSPRSRGPYRSATDEDVEAFRAWCRAHFPELLRNDEKGATQVGWGLPHHLGGIPWTGSAPSE